MSVLTGAWALAAGLALGLVGGGAHLRITRWRADLLARGGSVWILASMPLAIAPPLLAVVLALRIGAPAVWTCIAGMLVARWVLMRRLAEG